MPPRPKELERDPTEQVEVHRPDDRFLPIRACELSEALCADVEALGPSAAEVRAVAEAFLEVIEQEASRFERELCDHYANFNPDRDTIPRHTAHGAERAEELARLLLELEYLFGKANFEKLSDVQIDEAVHAANTYGLRVRLHPDQVEELSIWVRGLKMVERQRRDFRRPLRRRTVLIPVYRRLAVAFRLKDSPHLIMKLFKEIPIEDVQALMPHAEVRMNPFDRLLLLGGGAGTVGSTAAKVLTTVGSAAAMGKLLWVLILGLGTLAFRTVMGYRRARSNRDSQRTRHLYYQNLNNNAGVIHSLTMMTAQEELKEALMAYAFCMAADDRNPIASKEDLKGRIETYLKDRFDVEVQFDISDALESLTRLRLWADQARLRVVPASQAVERLREHWRSRRSQCYHQTMTQGG
jgi:hypothetical protein